MFPANLLKSKVVGSSLLSRNHFSECFSATKSSAFFQFSSSLFWIISFIIDFLNCSKAIRSNFVFFTIIHREKNENSSMSSPISESLISNDHATSKKRRCSILIIIRLAYEPPNGWVCFVLGRLPYMGFLFLQSFIIYCINFIFIHSFILLFYFTIFNFFCRKIVVKKCVFLKEIFGILGC